MISGMRKPSPISISSPRETMTSPPAASSFSARKIGRGVVVDGDAGRAGQPFQQMSRYGRRACRAGRPRGRIPDSNSRRAARSEASGARPRLVWRTTPVALITRRSEGTSRRSRLRSTSVGTAVGSARRPLSKSARMRAMTSRTSLAIRDRGNRPSRWPRLPRTSSTDGISRSKITELNTVDTIKG